MLNINFEKLRAGFLRYLPVGILVAVILFAELVALFYASAVTPGPKAAALVPIPDAATISNTKAIGMALYTHYVFLFQMAGIILLVAMIGAIVLTLRHRPGVRKQRISTQVSRKRADSVILVKVEPGQGV
jgi:NADH-quinone oxidoreductase subunit J